jgi:predicted HTH domain antitoxin
MGTISARVPDDLEAELEAYLDAENLDRSTAVRKLLTEGLDDWRKRHALERLETGEITFTRAAEIADVNIWDFTALVREHDVTWVSSEHTKDDLDDL